jgi:L-ascorbate metabolism protein UlaG (beta-lactamase superfamily)
MESITGVPLATFRLGIWRLGGASFVLRARKAPVVIVDPVLRMPPGGRPAGRPTGDMPPFPASQLQADIVLLTSVRPERFDPSTLDKSLARSKAWFTGPAGVGAELERMGITPDRFSAAAPGKRANFDNLAIEGRACAAGRTDISFRVAGSPAATRKLMSVRPGLFRRRSLP